LVGSLLAHSVGRQNHTKNSRGTIRAALKRDFGIRSNYIHNDQWTGISVARWMDLVAMNDDDTTSTDTPSALNLNQTLIPALWLIALWGLASSSNCLLDYFMALEQTGNVQLDSKRMGNGYHGMPTTSRPMFVEADFSDSKIQDAMDRLFHYYNQSCTYDEYRNNSNHAHAGKDEDDDLAAHALELVCATIELQQQYTNAAIPVLPNGYYRIDGGEIRADCVEVAIREIFYLLLWTNEASSGDGFLDLTRLPSTTCARLIELLRLENEHLKEASKSLELDFGKAWFDLLSNRRDCLYLSKSPRGTQYELAPNIEGMSVVLWSLLAAGDYKQQLSHPWRSLHDLADFWFSVHPETPLFVQQDTLRHVQSEDKVVEHETVVLGCKTSSRALEIRMRCDWEEACGMAAVTRLSEQHSQHQLDPEQVTQLHKLSASSAGKDIRASHDPSLAMLCLALPPWKDGMGIFSMLATPYGSDRRRIWLDSADKKNMANERNRQELMESQRILKEQILYACQLCQEMPRLGAQVLCWILQESPTVVERSESLLDLDKSDHSDIEDAILTLPTD
ncbi:MAG: hypothetical protein SGILL_010240, partial [Bacillariaceae sp.]